MDKDASTADTQQNVLLRAPESVTYWVQMNGAYSVTGPEGYPSDDSGGAQHNPSMFTWTMPLS